MATVEQHVRFENAHDLNGVLGTFGETARYDDEAWGEHCFARLDGMWALAIADLDRGRLVLSRDRFGIKPLHWALSQGALLVASEAKQVVAARGESPRANAALVAAFLGGTRYPCLEETFFEGVHPVPP